MRSNQTLLIVGLILIFLFSTCSIEKRRYRSGYNIEWQNSSSKTEIDKVEQTFPVEREVRKFTGEQANSTNAIADEISSKSTFKSKARTKHIIEASKQSADTLSQECDELLLINKEKIKVKSYEISKNEIRYRKCGETDGTILKLKKSDVFKIINRNGSQEIITDTNSDSSGTEESGAFGIISFVSMMLAILIFILFVGQNASVIIAFALVGLIPLAIVCGGIGLGKNRKNRVFALLGLILGIASVLLSIIAIIATSESSNCFVAGTRILTANFVEQNIETIKKGDSVLYYNFSCKQLVKTEVEKLVCVCHSNLFKLTFEEGEITVTDDHPFWVARKGWASINPGKSNNNYQQENSVDQLVVGDSFYFPASKKFTMLKNIQQIEKVQLTYTLELKEGNNFIANGLLVKTETVIHCNENQVFDRISAVRQISNN